MENEMLVYFASAFVLWFLATGLTEGHNDAVYETLSYNWYHALRLLQTAFVLFLLSGAIGINSIRDFFALISLLFIGWGLYELAYNIIAVADVRNDKKYFGMKLLWWIPQLAMITGIFILRVI